jgi:acetylornithine/succinyldiaminopimelate/putrescine aminotransferase
LAEPIQGRGGIVVPPPGWLAGVREICSRHGALLILDEIFTGCGRTGALFACQGEHVMPDILCIGKAMGGGLPISACVASASLMSCWPKSTGEALHTSTFLGNPLACAAALAALEILQRDRLPERAGRLGSFFRDRLAPLQQRHPEAIREIRGRGLMLGMEMTSPEIAISLVPSALRRGLIVLPAGDGSVLELVPPLVIEEDQIVWCVETLDALLSSPADRIRFS